MTQVLIIEDNPDDAALFKRLVERLGYGVDVAVNATQGLARAKTGNFDVVLTDLNLGVSGGGEGLELVKKLHAANPHLPVILMTGAHTTEIAIKATKLGAFDYFSKP